MGLKAYKILDIKKKKKKNASLVHPITMTQTKNIGILH